MRFYGFHGCLPEERGKGQEFFVDVRMYLDLQQAGKSDDLSTTVNYAEVFAHIKKIVEGEPFNLIESVAENIAADILASFASVQKLQVTLHKPHAPIAGDFRDAAVEIVRERA